jgi:hypothetical protein
MHATPAVVIGLGFGLACLVGLAPAGCNTGHAGLLEEPDAGVSNDGGEGGPPPDLNPDGVPYPMPAMFGQMARSGSTPGSVIQDFVFQGYPGGVITPMLSQIKLSTYYDPCNRRYKLIHLSVAALWCGPCNQETDQIVSLKSTLDADKVVVLQALNDGAQFNVGATQKDLDVWVRYHKSNFTEMLDPDPGQLGPFFQNSALPWNANIDPRTMEILDSSQGLPPNFVVKDIDPALMEVAGPPGYPIPADAHCD